MDASQWGMVAVGIRDFLIMSGIGVMVFLAKSCWYNIKDGDK